MSESKVAWVTGGSTGIGLAIAKALAELGHVTVISARNEALLRSAAEEIASRGGRCDYIINDVTDRAGVNDTARSILERHGRIDVLVNNAGFNSQRREWDDLIPDEFDAVIAANLLGTFNCIHATLPAMREQKSGLVINISSGAGKVIGIGAGVAYTVAKHGVHIMSRLLNQTELKNGIRACIIAPAFVNTRAHDWRPANMRQYMLQPEDVARAVRFAIDQPAHTAIFEIELGWSPA
ncbi:MAG: SDR family oxidoreductase [Novosphingobium sp.]|nr:SDR family oxidoreductase [Novosphingobium sp.]